jgi:prevent-host-death family protein
VRRFLYFLSFRELIPSLTPSALLILFFSQYSSRIFTDSSDTRTEILLGLGLVVGLPPLFFSDKKITSGFVHKTILGYADKTVNNYFDVVCKILRCLLRRIQLNYQQGADFMPNIKPVSDLRNYNDVLRGVAVKEPVFLTKNGRGRYALLDIQDYERMQASIHLLSELSKGEKSARENGWFTIDEVEASLGIL